jgi:polyhydroxybutyrate depolymerase
VPRPSKVLSTLGIVVMVALLSACSGQGDGRSDAGDAASSRVSGGSDPSTTTTTTADCSPARPASSGDAVFEHGGVQRTYTISIPEQYDGTVSAPLVFSLHGYASDKELQEVNTSMGARGAERGFVVVTPDALGEPGEWNMLGSPDGPADFEFIGALVDQLSTTLCIDDSRVFAAGHSNGSAFAGFLVCKEPFRFAAVAMVAAPVPSGCPDDVHPSALAISGDADPQVPYAGGQVGGVPIEIPGAVDTMEGYRTRSGCTTEAVVDESVPGVRSLRSTVCESGALVGFDTVLGGTHGWPGGAAARADSANSEAGRTWDATGAVLEFFDAAPPRSG